MKDITIKEHKKLIGKARSYALKNSYMDNQYGIFGLMADFHFEMLKKSKKKKK